MAIEGTEIVKKYLETLADEFQYSQKGRVNHLSIATPYLYPNNDVISLYIREITGNEVQVSDGGEAEVHLFKHGFVLEDSSQATNQAREIALAKVVDFDDGVLNKTGPREELGMIMLDVIQATLGVAHLRFTRPMYRPDIFVSPGHDPGVALRSDKSDTFTGNLKTFLTESNLEYSLSPRLTGNSGQAYTVDYKINGSAYLQALNPGQSRRAKSPVDRTFRMWADCNDALKAAPKITLLNDEAFSWKKPHLNLLSGVSTVINWSDRDSLVELLASRS